MICQSFSCVLKGIYHEGRPFFMAEFKPNGCRFEYGNPSGHSFIATGLYITMWDLTSRQFKLTSMQRKLFLVPIIALILILGASRIYNGVHTYNQVLAGYAWGLLTYATLCHVFYYEVCVFINTIKTKKLIELLWSPFIKMFVLANIAAFGLYFLNIELNPIPTTWIQHIAINCSPTELSQSNVEV